MNERLKAALEIALVLAGFFLFTWYAPGSQELIARYRAFIILFFAFSLLYLTCISPCLIFKDTLASRGLGGWNRLFIRTDNFKSALRGYGTVTVCGAVVIVGVTLLLQPARIAHINWNAFFLKLAFYLCSAMAQQLFFIGWLLLRLRTLLWQDDSQNQVVAKRLQLSAVAAAILFLLHAPNPQSMCISFVVGFAVAWVSYATPNLFLAILCHALLGTLLQRVALIQLRFGPHYLQKDFHFFQTLFPLTKKIIDNQF